MGLTVASWESLLQGAEEEICVPWIGGALVHGTDRTWTIDGERPPEHGWHRFGVGGSRKATWRGPGEPDPDFEEGRRPVRGYLLGDRLVPDESRVPGDGRLDRLVDETVEVHLAEPGLERFARAVCAPDRTGALIYVRQEFPLGPELEVLEAYQDRRDSVGALPGVTPALDLAFRWLTHRRQRLEARREALAAEQRRAEAEAQRLEDEEVEWQQLLAEEETERRAALLARHEAQHARREATRRRAERRAQVRRDFDTVAGDALALSGAELLDARPNGRRETVVQFRFRRRRFECVVETETLRIVDSGICLTDESTGERGDRYFTLESLPPVIAEAMDGGLLHVYRRI